MSAYKECAIRTIVKNLRKGWAVIALAIEVIRLGIRPSRMKIKCDISDPVARLWALLAYYYRKAEQFEDEEHCVRYIIARAPEGVLGDGHAANLYYKLKRYPEALAAADRALKNDPNFWLAFIVKGRIYRALGEWEDAIRQFRQALWISDEDADDGHIHAEIAGVYEILGRTEEASEHWRRAIALCPRLRDWYDK